MWSYLEHKLKKVQQQRHMYDIQMMILSNPIFKNLGKRDQKTLAKLIYKAELREMFLRDKNIIRINESFEDIVTNIANALNEIDERDRDARDEDDPDFR